MSKDTPAPGAQTDRNPLADDRNAPNQQGGTRRSASGDDDKVLDNTPDKSEDEIQFFEGTVAKMVERENADGDKEWIEVMSDSLYPGEKLKRVYDEEIAAEKAESVEDRKDRRDTSKERVNERPSADKIDRVSK